MVKAKTHRHHFTALLLIGITLAVFWPVCGHEFVVWDDQLNVYENPYLNPVTASNVLHFWKEPHQNLYIPLTYSIWAGITYFTQSSTVEKVEPRLDPGIFHVTNLLFHLLSVLVVFAILKMLVGNDWAACSGAMLFALHPMQVEPVAWVTGMKDVLCGLLSLVAVWQYIQYARARPEGYVRPARKNYIFATVAFVLALLAKPTGVIVPVMAWMLAYFALTQSNVRSSSHSHLPLVFWVFMAVPFVLVTKFAQDTAVTFVTPLWARPLVAGDALAFYFYKLFMPARLGIDYGRSPEFVLQQDWILLTGFLPYGLGAVFWLLRNRMQWLLVTAGVFTVGLLPVLGLIPFGFQDYSTVADRYLYLSMLGPALALAWLLSSYRKRRRGSLIPVVCVVFLGLLGIQSAFQVQHWSSNLTLFKHALEVNPRSSAGHNNLGLALAEQGKTADAIAHYHAALRMKPSNAKAHNNLGIALTGQGRTAEAIAHFQEALRIERNFADAHFNLGIALAKQREIEPAIIHYRETLRIKPNDAEVHTNLGNALLEQGNIAEAIAHYREALGIEPDDAAARHNLDIALIMQKKP